jgi:hypothetical protein
LKAVIAIANKNKGDANDLINNQINWVKASARETYKRADP